MHLLLKRLGPTVAFAAALYANVSLSHASTHSYELRGPKWNFASFHGGPVVAAQGGGVSTSLFLRYTPEYFIWGPRNIKRLSCGVNLGASAFHNADASRFAVIEYGAFLSYRFIDRMSARLLSGVQQWTNGNGTAPFVGTEAFYHFQYADASHRPPFIDNVYVSYTPTFQDPIAHQVHAGIGIQL